mgnify:CR=1 FL=1
MKETYVEINLDNLENNVKSIKEKYSNYKYHIAVIKSDAYGHGRYIVNSLYNSGINYVAVSYIGEALEIRKYNKEISILCLQPVDLDEILLAIDNNITVIVHDINYLDLLLKEKFNGKLKIHLKIDSGMNRLGFKDKNEVKKAYELITSNDNFILEGIFTHFATIGVFDKHYDDQVNKFKEITSLIDLNEIPIVHLGSSVILLSHPKLDFCNAVRMGILLYGYNVSYSLSNNGLKNKLRNLRNRYYQKKYNISKTFSNVKIDLRPSMKMYTKIIQIKNVKMGEYIGYGACFKAEKDMIIAVLPIGYSNGIGKKNNGRYVLINSKKYYMVGQMAMNMMTIEIDNSVKINDKVLILGDNITLGQMSRFNDWSISETLLNIGNSNRRIYIKGKNKIYEEDKN